MTLAIVASCILAGCGGPDDGAPVPNREAMTQQQLDAMPPEARAQAENAVKSGDFQSQRMAEMAAAQKKAQGGQ